MEILSAAELTRIEKQYGEGLSSATILKIFRPKGVRLSEATFRKYVQAGLLPRSRRVGTKGKHRGSHGVYPVEAVRRINAIKQMMMEGLTIDDIKRSFVVVQNHLELLERSFTEVLDGLDAAVHKLNQKQRRGKSDQIRSLRQRARVLVQDVAKVGSVLTHVSKGK